MAALVLILVVLALGGCGSGSSPTAGPKGIEMTPVGRPVAGAHATATVARRGGRLVLFVSAYVPRPYAAFLLRTGARNAALSPKSLVTLQAPAGYWASQSRPFADRAALARYRQLTIYMSAPRPRSAGLSQTPLPARAILTVKVSKLLGD